MRRIACLLVAAGCAAGLTLSGQSGPSPQVTFRAGIDVVRLDVTVLDSNRRPIRGLTAADFSVVERDTPQPIVAFAAIDIPEAISPAASWTRDVGSDVATNQLDTRRIIVIVMDDGTTSNEPGTSKAAKQIARQVIDRLGPNDLAAVVFTFRGRSQNFTKDHRLLVAAAETFTPSFVPPVRPMSAEAPGRGAIPSAAMGMPLGCLYRGRRGCLTDTLRNVAAALEDTPLGRKTIVLVSSGVPYNFSMENLEAGDDLDDLQETFRSLQRANVNVYPFDPSGLSADGIMAARLDTLRVFADSTGGRATVATNAPWDQVPQMLSENGSYYLLGIQPTNTAADGRFRRITVKVNRPGTEVRARSGYYAAQAGRRNRRSQAAPVTALDKAFGAALPTGTLPLDVAVAPFAGRGRKESVLAVAIGTRRPTGNEVTTETIEVRAAAFTDRGKQQASHTQSVELTLRPNAGGERRIEVPSRLTLPPGRYEVRVGAEGPGGVGGVFLTADAPDFSKARLGVSGLVMGRQRPEGPQDVLADLIPIAPTTSRAFSRSDPVTAFLRVYQGGKDPLSAVQMRARILDAASATAFERTSTLGPADFQTERAADYRLDLPSARLDAGEYLLTIDAALGRFTASRDVRFGIR